MTDGASGLGPADLRLLVPTLVAWVATLGLLGAPMPVVTTLAGLCALTAGAAAATEPARRRGTRSAASRGDVAGLSATVGLVLGAVALVLVSVLFHRELRSAGTVPALAHQGAVVTAKATVASDPQMLEPSGPARAPLVLVRLQVHQVTGRGASARVSSPVLAFGPPSWSGLMWGDTVQVVGRLATAEPGDDVVATLSGKGAPTVLRPAGRLRRGAGRLRAGLQGAVRGGPADGAGLLPGLVLGDTSRLSPSLKEAMRQAGLTHLVAVSGSNVAIVCGSVLWLAGRLGLPRRLRPPCAALALAGFVVVARPDPSVLRAAVMGGVALVGLASSRPSRGVPPLSAAVLVLLAVDPWLARSYGFALSVLATLGLLLLARPIEMRLARRLPGPVALALAVPLAAQAVCGPVIVLLQGSVSLAAVPANLLTAPFVAPATVLGVLAAVVSVPWPWGAHLLGWPGALVAEAIALVARQGARIPALPWPGGVRGAVLLAALTVMALLAAGRVARACARHPWAAALLVPSLVAACWPTGGVGWPPAGWVMVMCDVGQGDGLVLSTTPTHAMVVDTGPDPVPMKACLDRLGIRTVDLLVLTHDHADHVEGVPGVLAGRRAGPVLLNGLDDPPAEAVRVARWAAQAHLSVRTAQVGQTGQVGAVQFQVLWPLWVIRAGSVPNNASIVLLVRSHGLRLLLLGDVETPAAQQVALALAQVPGGPHVDVLKVAHHGSALQDPGLIREAGAPLALISVGAGNLYGHPAPTTVRMLAGLGATVLRTDQVGDIAVVADHGVPATVTRHH